MSKKLTNRERYLMDFVLQKELKSFTAKKLLNEGVDIPYSSLRLILTRLFKQGLLNRVRHGVYEILEEKTKDASRAESFSDDEREESPNEFFSRVEAVLAGKKRKLARIEAELKRIKEKEVVLRESLKSLCSEKGSFSREVEKLGAEIMSLESLLLKIKNNPEMVLGIVKEVRILEK